MNPRDLDEDGLPIGEGYLSYFAARPIAIRFPADADFADMLAMMDEVAHRMLEDERDHRLEASRRELEKLEETDLEKLASAKVKLSHQEGVALRGVFQHADKPRERPYEAQIMHFDLVELSDEELAQAKAEGRYTAIEDPE